jgi:hypothetical protein
MSGEKCLPAYPCRKKIAFFPGRNFLEIAYGKAFTVSRSK